MAASYRSKVLVLLGSAFTVTALAACATKDPTKPGDGIGTFSVTGALVASTCGTVPDPWAFSVQLRHDDMTLYWVQGDSPISATVNSAAQASFTASTTDNVTDATATDAACEMERDDNVALTVSPIGYADKDISNVTSFTGTLAYHFSVVTGSDCSAQLAAAGGDYATLPCDVSYTLTGTKTADAE